MNIPFFLTLALASYVSTPLLISQAMPGTVGDLRKISDITGDLPPGLLQDDDRFGISIAVIGDVDSDSVPDLAVGAYHDDGSGVDRGAVWILAMNSDGSVKDTLTIIDDQLMNTFGFVLDDRDIFGLGVCALGDLNNDQIPDLAVGALMDDDGGVDRGAIYILFLGSNGILQNVEKISSAFGNLPPDLKDGDRFGNGLACLGDLNGDQVIDVAVGASSDDGQGTDRGAVWVFGIQADGTVQTNSTYIIDDTDPVFAAFIQDVDHFGSTTAGIGDIDGDGIPDMAISANLDDAGGTDTGSVWIAFMNENGTPKDCELITNGFGGFPDGALDPGDNFGVSLVQIEDLNGDGFTDLACGAHTDDDGDFNSGAMYILFLGPDGLVRGHQKISETEGNFSNHGWNLDWTDEFGGGAASALQDLDGDGRFELFVGAAQDDDGGTSLSSNRGAIYVLDLEPCSSPYLHPPMSGYAGEPNTLLVTCVGTNNIVWFAYGTAPGSTEATGCPGVFVDIANAQTIDIALTDPLGTASITKYVPASASGMTILMQAVEVAFCTKTQLLTYTFK